MTAAEFQQLKTVLPTDLRTRELARLPAWVKEQASFMAGVTQATLAEAFRDAAARVAAGELSEQEALRDIRRALQETGYQPGDGQEGTIKDVSTLRRQMVSLRTAVELARGWAREQEQRKAGAAFPAQELFRAAGRKKARPWASRVWPAAVAQRNAARPDLPPLKDEVFIAPVGDPVWLLLSDFGVTYDPLKYGTGMRRRPVGFRKAQELGILPPRRPAEPVRSPGERLEVPAADWTPAQRADALRRLPGLAEFSPDGTALRFTDPNGTRPYPPPALARLIARPNGDGSDNYQLTALREWEALGGDENALAELRTRYAGRDLLDDFNRLTWRLEQADPSRSIVGLLTELAALVLL